MVRLVFRPYTQISRSICTSEPLRASTRVSPGFTLFRHSSPSFGSQHLCSNSNLSPKITIGRWCLFSNKKIPTSVRRTNLYFHYALEFNTQTLAYMLDSLVRVSRRAGYNHFVRITISQFPKDAKRDIAPRYLPSFSSKAFNSEGAYLPNDAFATKHIDANLSTHTDTWSEPSNKCVTTTLVAISSLLAISGTLSLSFQSSLHLSLTVLVRYRSLAII